MKQFKAFIALSLLAAFSLFTGTCATAVIDSALQVDVPVLMVSAPIFILSATQYFHLQAHPNAHSGTFFMGVTNEVWVKYIIDNLFKQNPHLMNCFREDDFVLGGAVVHIPQAGSKPTPVKNRSSFPATVISRTDTDIYYGLDVYDVPPTVIRNAEQAELSYQKMDSVYRENVAALADILGDDILYKWRAELTANILRTSGASVNAHLDSATGTRSKFLAADLKAARTRLNKLNIPKDGRVCLIESELLGQLQDDSTLQARDFAGELDMKNGIIARLWGFDIMERSSTLIYTNGTPPVAKAIDAAAAATDNASALCYHKDAVALAQGSVEFYEDLKNPSYYGDIYSANVRMGGRKRRTNGEGVVAIVQTLLT